MVARSILVRHLRSYQRPLALPYNATRYITSQTAPKTRPSSSSATPPEREKSWLTRKVESSPAAMRIFVKLTNALGYGSPKQLAGRRAFAIYEHVCATKPDHDAEFWQKECHLPPTFQSWFTVTNLHIWLLTVRLRALPKEHGKLYIQALIDHFFIDVEDRIRAVLQPPATPAVPYTFNSPFYINPNASTDAPTTNGKPKPRSRAPDRLVTRQMKIFKEQWAGLGIAFDLGLVNGDMEMAGAVWRNLLGARGASGITFPESSSSDTPTGATTNRYRRTVNLVGGEVVNVAKVDFEKEQIKDDGSGVHDFAPEEVDLYLKYPELMLDIVTYARRELVRLEGLSDKEIMGGQLDKLRFGRVRV
ncbi:hypothetical protein BDZ94DRAFT_1269086 [Collybia nuda]|uniref:Ubiquinol-cytochrome c chaperone domain-containing protein n=1 Tax=Collybia nuda TaxID=64659 RepID=A0A9P6CEG2_9AGAR|nr:hypothetical protein BDZ94DRAFT_1269086 [Collybia nuda]